jgi:hypothetical protein
MPLRAKGFGRNIHTPPNSLRRGGPLRTGRSFVPLGYEPNGRTLTIKETEAETVRTVFLLYLKHGNVRRVKEEADCLGLTTKIRKGTDGRMRGGRPLSRGYVYKLLGNPLRRSDRAQGRDLRRPASTDYRHGDLGCGSSEAHRQHP